MTLLALVSSVALLFIFPENNLPLSIAASVGVVYFFVMTIYKTYFYKER
jgi:hypothetical protein